MKVLNLISGNPPSPDPERNIRQHLHYNSSNNSAVAQTLLLPEFIHITLLPYSHTTLILYLSCQVLCERDAHFLFHSSTAFHL